MVTVQTQADINVTDNRQFSDEVPWGMDKIPKSKALNKPCHLCGKNLTYRWWGGDRRARKKYYYCGSC